MGSKQYDSDICGSVQEKPELRAGQGKAGQGRAGCSCPWLEEGEEDEEGYMSLLTAFLSSM